MKRLFKGIMLIVMVAILTTVPTQYANATEDDFNYVQWYEEMGIYTVIGEIMSGTLTPEEACLLIIIPADDSGVVSENQKKYSLSIIPKQREFWKHMALLQGLLPQ